MKNFLLSLLLVASAAGAGDRLPQIEFNCRGINNVVFFQDGTLQAGKRTYQFAYFEAEVLYFTGGTKIVGERHGEEIWFDTSRLTVGGVDYTCTAE